MPVSKDRCTEVVELKQCGKCGQWKDPHKEFYKDKRKKDGFTWNCRDCNKVYREQHRNDNRMYEQKHKHVLFSSSYETISNIISYNPLTGECFANNKPVRISYNKQGYGRVRILGYKVAIHRVAWFLTYKRWPTYIDHIDGNIQNNRISNLRECTQQENCLNKIRHREGGLVGATYIESMGKWKSVFSDNDGNHILGYFETERDASIEACRAYINSGLVRREFLPRIFSDNELGVYNDK